MPHTTTKGLVWKGLTLTSSLVNPKLDMGPIQKVFLAIKVYHVTSELSSNQMIFSNYNFGYYKVIYFPPYFDRFLEI